MAKRIATDQKYTVGSPFHFEMLFNPPGGFDETITISGVVVYNNGEIAVVKVSFRFFEFEGVVHTIEETRKRFPDYEPADTPKHDDEYLWIRTSIDGFDGFIPNEEF